MLFLCASRTISSKATTDELESEWLRTRLTDVLVDDLSGSVPYRAKDKRHNDGDNDDDGSHEGRERANSGDLQLLW